jgi:hypothetical protein
MDDGKIPAVDSMQLLMAVFSLILILSFVAQIAHADERASAKRDAKTAFPSQQRSDPFFLKKASTGVIQLVVTQFETLCKKDRTFADKYEAGETDFLNKPIAKACKQMGLTEDEFGFANEAYLSLSVLYQRLMRQVVCKTKGWRESLGADGYPLDLSHWVPPSNGRDKPIELFEQMMSNKATAGEGYYHRGVLQLVNQLPKLALIDLEKACELANGKLKSGAFCYKAIAKWQLNDHAGALAAADYSMKIATPGPGRDFTQKVLTKMMAIS